MWARAVRSVSVSVSAAGVALCEGAPKRRLSTPPPRRRVTPVVDLEREVIVLERQVAGEPLTRVTLSAMVDDMADPDRKLLLFGEQHDDAVAQDVQRAVYDDLTRRRSEKLALALEFVDADARDAARAFSDGSSDDVDALFHGAGHYPPDFTMPAFLAAAAACVGAATLAEAISPPHVDNLLVTYAAAATAFCLNESGIAPFLMQTCA